MLDGTVAFVPDAPGADLLVAVGEAEDGTPVAAVVPADADGVSVEPVVRYDATRALGHVTFANARGRRLNADADALGGCLVRGSVAARGRGCGSGADLP